MKRKKNYAFQFGTAPRWGNGKIYQDIDSITLDEAKALWRKWLPTFLDQLGRDNNPEMCIWGNMKNEYDYHTRLINADKYTETDGKKIWETKKEYIDIDNLK